MSLPYSINKTDDGSYYFISEPGHNYLVYFSESKLLDAHGNTHILYNLGFGRDGEHLCKPFLFKHDDRIRSTVVFIIVDFFQKYEHKTLVFFCFGEDGYSRHRSIVFNSWCKDLNVPIEKRNYVIKYEQDQVYGSLIIAQDNPLKSLILNAFESYLKELTDKG